MKICSIRFTLVLSGIAALFLSAPIAAQNGAPLSGRVPVLVALVPGGRGGATIKLPRGRSDFYTIVMSEDGATAMQLAVAAIAITARMDVVGEDLREDAVLRVDDAASAPAQEIATATKVLASLRSSQRTVVRGLGAVHTAYIYLPSQATRDKVRASGKGRFGKP